MLNWKQSWAKPQNCLIVSESRNLRNLSLIVLKDATNNAINL